MDHANFRVRIASCLISFLPMSRCHRLKANLLRLVGLKVGKNVEIWSSAKFYSPYITIGDYSYIGYNVQLFANKEGEITIGNNCVLGTDVIVITGSHYLGPRERRSGPGYVKPITIGDGARISTRSVLLEGVKVGAGSQIAAGAVVVYDVAENTLVGGVPARLIKVFPF